MLHVNAGASEAKGIRVPRAGAEVPRELFDMGVGN